MTLRLRNFQWLDIIIICLISFCRRTDGELFLFWKNYPLNPLIKVDGLLSFISEIDRRDYTKFDQRAVDMFSGTYMRSKIETTNPSQVFRSVFRLAHNKICFMLDFSIVSVLFLPVCFIFL